MVIERMLFVDNSVVRMCVWYFMNYVEVNVCVGIMVVKVCVVVI